MLSKPELLKRLDELNTEIHRKMWDLDELLPDVVAIWDDNRNREGKHLLSEAYMAMEKFDGWISAFNLADFIPKDTEKLFHVI